MIQFINVNSGNSVAYHKTAGNSPGIVFLGGFMSDMDGTKALFLEEYARLKGEYDALEQASILRKCSM